MQKIRGHCSRLTGWAGSDPRTGHLGPGDAGHLALPHFHLRAEVRCLYRICRSRLDGDGLEDKSHFRGVWVFLEGRAGHLRDVSTQLIGEGRRLADLRGTPLTGILPGKGVDALAEQAIGYGLDRVIVVDDPILEIYRSRPYAQVMAQLIRRHKPELVLFGASKNGRDLGGRLAALLETGLAADCVKFDIDAEGNLDMIRPSFGGKSLAH